MRRIGEPTAEPSSSRQCDIQFDFGAGFGAGDVKARFRSSPNPLRVIPLDFFKRSSVSGLGVSGFCDEAICADLTTSIE